MQKPDESVQNYGRLLKRDFAKLKEVDDLCEVMIKMKLIADL